MRNATGTGAWSWWPNANEVPRLSALANSSDSDSWNGLAFKNVTKSTALLRLSNELREPLKNPAA